MHQEVIISGAKKIFDRLSYFPNFYLVGGTGLALQLGHRISVDFDLFWQKDIPKDLLLKVRKFIEYQGIKILPPLEIAAMKAYALGRRATLKDYVDLYFVLKEKINSLQELITFCEEKYGSEFYTRLFLEQLIYLKDIEKIEIQFLKEKVSIPEMEEFFEGEVKKIKF